MEYRPSQKYVPFPSIHSFPPPYPDHRPDLFFFIFFGQTSKHSCLSTSSAKSASKSTTLSLPSNFSKRDYQKKISQSPSCSISRHRWLSVGWLPSGHDLPRLRLHLHIRLPPEEEQEQENQETYSNPGYTHFGPDLPWLPSPRSSSLASHPTAPARLGPPTFSSSLPPPSSQASPAQSNSSVSALSTLKSLTPLSEART